MELIRVVANDSDTHRGKAFGVQPTGLAKTENCYMRHCGLSLP
jgi:hypothetical protein